jgi:hypothetical protein
VKRRAAVFTIVQNEPVFLPVWARHYQRHFAKDDIYVLDHDSTDRRTVELAEAFQRVPVHRAESFNHQWLVETVQSFQAFLLSSYEVVLFAEADEIVAADPELCPSGLTEIFESACADGTPFVRCTGYDIVHDRDNEAPLDWAQPILAQRASCRRSVKYSKPVLSSEPLNWTIGFHDVVAAERPAPNPDPRLLLLHLHRADYETARAKTIENAARRWSAEDLEKGAGWQNRIVDEEEFSHWFDSEFHDDRDEPLRPIPEGWKMIL